MAIKHVSSAGIDNYTDSCPVQFVGQWNPDERHLIFNVISRVERSITGGENGTADPWEPWVALLHTLREDDRYYTAHRLQHDRVVVARSAEELANKIAQAKVQE